MYLNDTHQNISHLDSVLLYKAIPKPTKEKIFSVKNFILKFWRRAESSKIL